MLSQISYDQDILWSRHLMIKTWRIILWRIVSYPWQKTRLSIKLTPSFPSFPPQVAITARSCSLHKILFPASEKNDFRDVGSTELYYVIFVARMKIWVQNFTPKTRKLRLFVFTTKHVNPCLCAFNICLSLVSGVKLPQWNGFFS